MTTQLANQLKYANLQLAAEAFFVPKTDTPGKTYDGAIAARQLTEGNTRSSKFTTESAEEFSKDWAVVEHKANTTTGFSGTLFRALRSDQARGIKAGELVLSFLSTEFPDDSARDNQATNELQINTIGWAFGPYCRYAKQVCNLKTLNF
jgi:hypothetical protein